MKTNYDFIIVGGGIVGLATAYKLQLKFPNKTVAVIQEFIIHQTHLKLEIVKMVESNWLNLQKNTALIMILVGK